MFLYTTTVHIPYFTAGGVVLHRRRRPDDTPKSAGPQLCIHLILLRLPGVAAADWTPCRFVYNGRVETCAAHTQILTADLGISTCDGRQVCL